MRQAWRLPGVLTAVSCSLLTNRVPLLETRLVLLLGLHRRTPGVHPLHTGCKIRTRLRGTGSTDGIFERDLRSRAFERRQQMVYRDLRSSCFDICRGSALTIIEQEIELFERTVNINPVIRCSSVNT